MKNFHHPNVLQVLGISLETEDGLPYILLPYMANGDLRTFLKSKRPEALVVDQFPEVFIIALIYLYVCIKTHDGESLGQEEACCT